MILYNYLAKLNIYLYKEIKKLIFNILKHVWQIKKDYLLQ